MNRTVTLTDENGADLGEADILEAHTGEGKLHKAFSVFIFSSDREKLLIQRRSDKKMLWPGFWANTCCSHPLKDEPAVDAGKRRLNEELGFTCDLIEGPTFTYHAKDPFGKGSENEFDTILIGTCDQSLVIKPNPDEVSDYKWMNTEELAQDMKENPTSYAPWLHIGLPKLIS